MPENENENENEYATMFMRTIPADVKKQFKAWCATNGFTMTEKIVELMKETYEPAQPSR